jgi:hypothetical protein
VSQASKESIDMVLDAIGSQGAGAVDRADAALAKSRLAEPGGADEPFFRFPRLTLTTSLHHMRCDECERWVPPATRCGMIALSVDRRSVAAGLICAACTDDECSAREQFYREWSAFTETASKGPHDYSGARVRTHDQLVAVEAERQAAKAARRRGRSW